jgi:plasmid stability protein
MEPAMPTLIIRDVPEKVYQRIKDSAKEHRRSLAKEALVMLEARLDPYDVPRVDWSKLPKIRLRGKVDASPEAIKRAIEEGRE